MMPSCTGPANTLAHTQVHASLIKLKLGSRLLLYVVLYSIVAPFAAHAL